MVVFDQNSGFSAKMVVLTKTVVSLGLAKGVPGPGEQYSQTRHVCRCRIYRDSGFLQHPMGVILEKTDSLWHDRHFRDGGGARGWCARWWVPGGVYPWYGVWGHGADPTGTPWYGSGSGFPHCLAVFPLDPTVWLYSPLNPTVWWFLALFPTVWWFFWHYFPLFWLYSHCLAVFPTVATLNPHCGYTGLPGGATLDSLVVVSWTP